MMLRNKLERAAAVADIEPIHESRTEVRDWSDPSAQSGASGASPVARGQADAVVFDRTELREILNLYGRKVAAGEWRDYAIDFMPHKAVFSVFRRTSEYALYRIEKTPKLARRQGAYAVVAPSGLILKRGHDLRRVIEVLDKRLKVISG